MSAANRFRTAIVIDSARDPTPTHRFDEITERVGIDVVANTPTIAEKARQAY